MKIISSASYVFLILALLFACNDPSVVGLDLVEDDQIDVIFSDELPFELTTVEGRGVPTYTVNEINGINVPTTPTSFLCGRVNHPTFGVSEASIFSELALNLSKPITNVRNLTMDSIVLVLPYDTTAFYGDTTELVTIEVFEVLEQLEETETYFHNTPIMTSEMPIGTHSFVPAPNVTYETVSYRNSRIDTLESRDLRIPLSLDFGQRLIDQDTLTFENDTVFSQFLNGIKVRIKNTERTMLSFELTPENDGFRAGVYMYYDTLNTGGVPIEYVFPLIPLSRFNAVKFTQFEHDYSDTPVLDNIGDTPANEELIYVQGMGGVNGKLVFPDLDQLGDIVVNQAKLEVVVFNPSQADRERFPPPEQILLFEQNAAGELELVSDFEVAARAVGNPALAFGGNLEDASLDSLQRAYTILFSNHFQEMIQGEATNELFIQVSPPASRIFTDTQTTTKASRANWAALGTEQHKDERFRAKFSLTYTRLN
ncbi:MAG: DUF4270 family protein [Bacteroidota bacterium]